MSTTSRRRAIIGVAALCAAACSMAPKAAADSRAIVIDARYKPMRKVYNDYRKAVLGNGQSKVVNRRITLLVSANRGFDAGYLQVPRNTRIMRTHVDVIVYHGPVARRRVSVNLLSLDRARIYQLNQSLRVR